MEAATFAAQETKVMRQRVIINSVSPEIDGGRYYVKRVPGNEVNVTCTAFGDGHDHVRCAVRYKHEKARSWQTVMMTDVGQDRWTASFPVEKRGFYTYEVEGWVDPLLHWYIGFGKKADVGQHLPVELQIGAELLERAAVDQKKPVAAKLRRFSKLFDDSDKYNDAYAAALSDEFAQLIAEYPLRQFVTVYDNNLRVRVGRRKEVFSSWYELFPRAASPDPERAGTFSDVEGLLPRIAELGFDVLYMPPIHPVGEVNRKGKNNSTEAEPGEPGSPWAIGSRHGGHKAVDPGLGTLADYKQLVLKAKREFDIEVALDLAFQCAPDHPWIEEHPEWFIWRPDGTIAYAENPPKKYQDIVPINFETEDWENLWEALLDVILFWNKQGVKIFRVDNPHTKAFRFWEWVIAKAQAVDPDLIFLAEAFTRPAVMLELAKLGYSQSYSYFVWRTSPAAMRQYLEELTGGELREVMRANLWPNTPDILPLDLMNRGEAHFMLRLGLAATLSSNFGVYGPAYEFLENVGADTGKDEYHNSEKYELRHYDWNARNRLTAFMTALNTARKQHAALQDTFNITFSGTDNGALQSYVKVSGESKIWCVVNWDADGGQGGWIETPRAALGITGAVDLRCRDLLTEEVYYWKGEWNYVALDPRRFPMHLFEVTVYDAE